LLNWRRLPKLEVKRRLARQIHSIRRRRAKEWS